MAVEKIAGLSVFGGGVAAAASLLLINFSETPDWRPLNCDKEYSDNGHSIESTYSTKYGSRYSRLLVGTGTPREGAENTKNNEAWWKWSFENRYSDKNHQIRGKFKNIKSAEELKKTCDEAYKETDGESGTIKEVVGGGRSDNDKFKEWNIWFLCSPAEEKVKSISDMRVEQTEYITTSPYGNDETTKKDLVSVKSESKGNIWFWNLQRERYRRLNNQGKPNIDRGDVRAWCEKAYRNTDTTGDFSKTNVFTWCSISGKEHIIVKKEKITKASRKSKKSRNNKVKT